MAPAGTFLKDVIKRAADRGIRIQAPEDEFYLCKQHPRPARGVGRRQRCLPRDRLRLSGKLHTTMQRTLRSMMMPGSTTRAGRQQEISIHHEHALGGRQPDEAAQRARRGPPWATAPALRPPFLDSAMAPT